VSVVAVTLYHAVLALHIMAVLAAYGQPLTIPVLLPYLRRSHPRAMPGVHDAQHTLDQRLVVPASILIFVFGAYMVTKGHYWTEVWVDVPIGLFAAISLIGATYIVPVCQRMAELAASDVEVSGPTTDVTWGAEYDRVFRRYLGVEILLGLMVLTAVFFMAAKPFA
jgi:hypothetical protein